MTDPRTAAAPESNATVLASAGTGKTYLLVTRLVRLLLAGAVPDAILAITFTRKAAAEMQSRLAERALGLAAASPEMLDEALEGMGLIPNAATRERARHLYEALLHAPRPVRTTTFHAFCQEILRRFPLEADVPPGFELTERTGALEAAARDALFAEATAEPDGPLGTSLDGLLDYAGQSGLNAALTDFLTHRSDWWAYTEAQPSPVEFATTRLAEQLSVAENEHPVEALFTPTFLADVDGLRAALLRHPIATHLTRAEQLALTQERERPAGERFAAVWEACFTQKEEPRKLSTALLKKLNAEEAEQLQRLHAEICARLQRTRERQNSVALLRACRNWYTASQRLLDHYQRIKREQRLLDFADLEWGAYRLLNHADHAHWVQYKLDQRIDHLLVDEFQDTNPTQWRLLLPLLEEIAAGGGERPRSVFLVGDAKQSIYRFRRAEPRLLQTAQEWLQERLDATTCTLDASRRSASAIMTCVNRLFSDGGPMAEVMEPFPHHDTHHTALWGRVELLPLCDRPQAKSEAPEALRNPLTTPRPEEGEDPYRREGAQIAERIRALVGQIPIGAAAEARPLRHGDICILVRRRTHVHAYEEALRDAGIPYAGADRGTLLESLEVCDMLDLLRTLITPYDNLALAAVLRSPLFACSDNDLLALSGSGHGVWFDRLERIATGSAPPAALARAWKHLSRWHQAAGSLPIHDLLDRIYHETDAIARYEGAFPPHLRDRVRANLTRLIELALEIDQGRYPSLTRFIARLAELRDQKREAPDEAPAGTATDRVRIMTIHAAKGLEAPVVFLADSAGHSNQGRPFRALVEWPTNAAAPTAFTLVGKKVQRDPHTRRLLEREAKAEKREEANLFYVALTRARQLLFLSGVQPRGDALGWYGAVAAILGGDKTDDAPPCIESGHRTVPS